MTAETAVLVSLLRLTQEGPISKGLIGKDARVPVQVADGVLEKISGEGLIQLRGKAVAASVNQRVKVAIRAINLGADFERVCRALRWDEFENITATAFLANNFTVTKRFRFKHAGRRWEIDVIAYREPIIACVDCKRWRHGWTKSASAKAVEAQIERTKALASILPTHQELGLTNWRKATVIPVILSLVPAPLKFHRNTAIVPILQLQNFLDELPAHANTLKHFLVTFENHTTGS